MKTDLQKVAEQMEAAGIEGVKDVDPFPERTAYINCRDQDTSEMDAEDFAKYRKRLKFMMEDYVLVFHQYFSVQHKHILFEKTNDKVYWEYNVDTGIYDELSFPEVRGLLLKLLIDEGLVQKATEVNAKTIINKYRSFYSHKGVNYDDFDIESEWFHAKNGWVHLTTRKFKEHTPEIYTRRVSEAIYDAKATCPLYDAFLDVESRMPEDQTRVIDQFSGYILTDTIEAEEMLIFEGRPGSGKSMVPEVWLKVLGNKSISTSLNRVGGDNQFTGDELADRTFCFIDEANPKTKDINESFQNLVTQPTIRVERKGIQAKSFITNRLKLVMCVNEMPDHMPPGMDRRYRHILFTRSFQDEGIKDGKIRVNIIKNELSGVLNRMLEGLADYKKMGMLTIIANEIERKHEYNLGADDFSAFLSDHFEPTNDTDVRYTYEEMKTSFVAEFPKKYNEGLSTQAFNKKLLSNRLNEFSRIDKGQTKTHRGYTGLKLKKGHSFPTHAHEKIITPAGEDW